jgi:hypothetical protein
MMDVKLMSVEIGNGAVPSFPHEFTSPPTRMPIFGLNCARMHQQKRVTKEEEMGAKLICANSPSWKIMPNLNLPLLLLNASI